METITVTATKSEKNIDGVSASVVVVSQKQIEKMGPLFISTALNPTTKRDPSTVKRKELYV